MSDEWNEELLRLGAEDAHDKYIQYIISVIEDPDYDRYPVVVDGLDIMYPDGCDKIALVKILKVAIETIKELVFDDDPDSA